MNFNISNSINFSPFFTSKNGNKLTEGQIWFLTISTALKQSLSFYQMQWKQTQNCPNESNSNNKQIRSNSQSFESDSKRVQGKQINDVQQNKKSIQKISYNSDFQKNDKIEQKCDRNQIISEEKTAEDEHKQLKTACEYPEKNKQKIIHQNIAKQSPNFRNKIIESKGLVDLYEAAYIPHNSISNNEIQQKRQKLLMRKVLNWKQIDKRVGFRKMELKKLLG